MKSFIIVLIALVAVYAADETTYTTKFDGINIDEILNSDRLFNNYFKCLIDDNARCPPDARELKRILPDALQTECSKCNEKQKEGAQKVIDFILKNKKKEWEELKAKYDPQGIYLEKYRAEAEKRGIKV